MVVITFFGRFDGISSVSHLQIIFCFSLANTLKKIFCNFAGMEEIGTIDPREKTMNPFEDESANVLKPCRT